MAIRKRIGSHGGNDSRQEKLSDIWDNEWRTHEIIRFNGDTKAVNWLVSSRWLFYVIETDDLRST